MNTVPSTSNSVELLPPGQEEITDKLAELDIQDTEASQPTPTEPEPARSTDPLQVAAQAYPWMFMNSTLDACFKDAESTAIKDLESKAKEVDTEQAEISEQQTRVEAESLVEFYDGLSSDPFSKDAPKVMQSFLTHGETCSATEYDAMRLAAKEFDVSDDADLDHPMDTFNVMLDKLDSLLQEAETLHGAITRLIAVDPYASFEGSSESTVARATIVPLFGSCLPALKGRTANLSLAQQLVEGAKERYAMDVHLASLEFDDDESGVSESAFSQSGDSDGKNST